MRNGWMDSMTDEQRGQMLDQLGEQLWKNFESGNPGLTPAFPSEPVDTVSEGLDPKELYIRTDLIPFDKLESFFTENM